MKKIEKSGLIRTIISLVLGFIISSALMYLYGFLCTGRSCSNYSIVGFFYGVPLLTLILAWIISNILQKNHRSFIIALIVTISIIVFALLYAVFREVSVLYF